MACSKEMPVSLTTCSICFETFKVPKSLPCLHTFCEECITKYITSVLSKSEAPKGSFQCPICRCVIQQPEGIDKEEWGMSFPLNHLMINIMDYESVKEGRLCNSCKRENETESATNWCVECREPFCTNCTKWHRRFQISENHNIVPISEFDQTCFPPNSTLKCTKHPERTIEAFCSDHNVQCCLACVTLDHRKCEDVGTVEAAAEKLRKSKILQDLEMDLSNIDERLKELVNKKDENINELLATSIRIKSKVVEVRKKIDAHLDQIQSETLKELSKIEQNVVPALKMEKEELECQQSVVSSGLGILKTGLNYASDAQLLFEIDKIKEAKMKLEKFLNKACISQVRIHHETSIEFSDIESQIKRFVCILTDELAQKCFQHLDPMKGKAMKLLEFKTSSGYFTGGVILSNDQFLIAQYSAKALEMYDLKGNLLSQLVFDGCPWCVEMIGEKSGVVTVYDKNMIVFFDISDDVKLIEMNRITFSTNCFDIRFQNNKLYMACGSKIIILDAAGTHIGQIGPLSSIARFLDIDPVSSTICYSSNTHDILTCIDMKGSKIFTYTSDQLSRASSISRDFAGNIYVVGNSSNNIHQLDKNGRFNKIIVSGLSICYVVRFQKNSTKFLSNRRGTAMVYEIVEA